MSRVISQLAILMTLAMGGMALAQAVGPQTELLGKIDRFTISPAGLPDGFILDNEIEVHFHRYLGRSLASALNRGELVRAKGIYVVNDHLMLGSSVTDLINHQTVIDAGAPQTPVPASPEGVESSTEGQVLVVLHGYLGQPDGAILDNDVTVRLPDEVAASLPELLVVGQNLAVRGREVDTENGRLIRMESMGSNYSELTPLRPTGLPKP
jgi:hypothetical protein